MPFAKRDHPSRGVFLTHYQIAGRPVLIAVGRTGELLAQRPVPADWPMERAIGALVAWLEQKDPPTTLRLVSASPEPLAARQTTRPVLPPELCVSRAHYEILHGWRKRGGKPPRRG